VDDPILRDWYPGIGTAVIENWKLPRRISQAVGGQLDTGRSHEGEPADLQDLLVVAVVSPANGHRKPLRFRDCQISCYCRLGLSDSR